MNVIYYCHHNFQSISGFISYFKFQNGLKCSLLTTLFPFLIYSNVYYVSQGPLGTAEVTLDISVLEN